MVLPAPEGAETTNTMGRSKLFKVLDLFANSLHLRLELDQGGLEAAVGDFVEQCMGFAEHFLSKKIQRAPAGSSPLKNRAHLFYVAAKPGEFLRNVHAFHEFSHVPGDFGATFRPGLVEFFHALEEFSLATTENSGGLVEPPLPPPVHALKSARKVTHQYRTLRAPHRDHPAQCRAQRVPHEGPGDRGIAFGVLNSP